MTDLVRQLPPYISVRTSARALGLVFAAIFVVSWVAVGFDIAEIRRLEQVAEAGSVNPLERDAYFTVNVLLAGAQTVLVVTAALGFLAWLFRARVNARAFGMRRFEYGREWTILGFLIPILNLLRPYQVVREVWMASDPRHLDPFEWKLAESPGLVRLWWGSLIGYVILELIAVGMGHSSGLALRRLQLALATEMLADLGGALSAALAFPLVIRLSRNQDEKWERLQRHAANAT